MKNSERTAFPSIYTHALDGTIESSEGLTKREYFAAIVMQGIIAGTFSSEDAYNSLLKTAVKKSYSTVEQCVSKIALAYADALLTELESGT